MPWSCMQVLSAVVATLLQLPTEVNRGLPEPLTCTKLARLSAAVLDVVVECRLDTELLIVT